MAIMLWLRPLVGARTDLSSGRYDDLTARLIRSSLSNRYLEDKASQVSRTESILTWLQAFGEQPTTCCLATSAMQVNTWGNCCIDKVPGDPRVQYGASKVVFHSRLLS